MKTLTSLLFLSLFLQACGQSSSQNKSFNSGNIIDGVAINFGSAPFNVMITNPKTCSASFIAPTFLLTAAHCLDGVDVKELKVSMGDKINFYKPSLNLPSPKAIHIHPSYDQEYNDIALIELSAPLKDADKYMIPLYDAEILMNAYFPTEIYGFSVWTTSDVTDLLSYFKIEITTNYQSNYDENGFVRLQGKKVIAAKVDEDPKGDIKIYQMNGGICSGDSGGPLVVTINGYKTQIGIHKSVESLEGKTNCNAHGYITPIPYYIPWLKKVIANSNATGFKTYHFKTPDLMATFKTNDDFCLKTQGTVYGVLYEGQDNIREGVCDERLIEKLEKLQESAEKYCASDFTLSYTSYLENSISRLSQDCE